MKLFSISEGLIYPGVMTSIRDLKTQLQKKHTISVRKPTMRIFHSKEIWEVYMDFPGVEKKDISAKIINHILMVCAPSNPLTKDENNEYNCWQERHVELPGDADVLFITAHFNNGVIKIIIPRTSAPDYVNIDNVTIY